MCGFVDQAYLSHRIIHKPGSSKGKIPPGFRHHKEAFLDLFPSITIFTARILQVGIADKQTVINERPLV